MDRVTGRIIRGFAHVVQSVGDILTTNIGERIHREWYGFPGFRLLGEPLNRFTLVKFLNLIFIALTMRQKNGLPVEPRFRVIRAVPLAATRQGEFRCRLEGEYMPRGHLGDFTVEGKRKIVLTNAGNRFTAIEDTGALDG
ncbi:baseplate assembly protein [Bosea sp. (in: a-proteobacteria)]|uniref:GPW/gp25 family protein n=1 Tax=Bosea sp. (in: a-proteobacteria) TaxID=1871050 RepID=UPI001AC1DF57|nr:baseplate assembly protein [Bosea sp. (in: a-proteobacteria)]MBN9444382.1 baseplate assembly protein [Bosea sp. (in: a-proteobacteria)]